MRKPLAILLISIHLIGNTELGQAFKLPKLISHYFQHHRKDTSVNFFKFIVMHYAGDDGTSADDNLDNQLPCHNVTNSTIGSVYSPMLKDISFLDFSFWHPRQYSAWLQEDIPSAHILLILKPPRLV